MQKLEGELEKSKARAESDEQKLNDLKQMMEKDLLNERNRFSFAATNYEQDKK